MAQIADPMYDGACAFPADVCAYTRVSEAPIVSYTIWVRCFEAATAPPNRGEETPFLELKIQCFELAVYQISSVWVFVVSLFGFRRYLINGGAFFAPELSWDLPGPSWEVPRLSWDVPGLSWDVAGPS